MSSSRSVPKSDELSSIISSFSGVLKSTSVIYLIYSTVLSLEISVSHTEPSFHSKTPWSVISISTQLTPVHGKSIYLLNFFSPYLSVIAISTITFLQDDTRSMAPPMPLTNLPGMIQLARSPDWLTYNPPKIVMSKWSPLIILNASALSTNTPPFFTVTVSLPALINSGSSFPGSG